MSMMPDIPPQQSEMERWLIDNPPPTPLVPDAPVYTPPLVETPAAPGFMDRLGTALAGVQTGPAGRPYESGGSAFVRGLLGGGSQGLARTTAKKSEDEAAGMATRNANRKSEADRNWENISATWRSKLTAQYRTQASRDGKVKVTAQMASDMNRPEAAGTYMDPVAVGDRIQKQRSVARVPAELAGTMGMAAGSETTPQAVLEARRLLKKPAPKPAPAPKAPKATPKHTLVAGIVADLNAKGRSSKATVQEYLAQPGVGATLAKNGLTPNDILREFPE